MKQQAPIPLLLYTPPLALFLAFSSLLLLSLISVLSLVVGALLRPLFFSESVEGDFFVAF